MHESARSCCSGYGHEWQASDGAEKLQTSCLEALRAYRSLCPPHAKNMSTLLLPESLKLMPLYTLGLMKSALFNAADVRPDERSAAFYAFSTMALPHSTAMLHPRLIQAHPPTQQVSPAVPELPRSLPLSATSLSSEGAFLIEDGFSSLCGSGVGCTPTFCSRPSAGPPLRVSTIRASPSAGRLYTDRWLLAQPMRAAGSPS